MIVEKERESKRKKAREREKVAFLDPVYIK